MAPFNIVLLAWLAVEAVAVASIDTHDELYRSFPGQFSPVLLYRLRG